MMKVAVSFSVALAMLVCGAAARADELKVLAPTIMQPAMTDLAAGYDRLAGVKLAITYDPAGAIKTRFQKGEAADVVILPKPDLAVLAKERKIAAASIRVVARTAVVLAVRKGQPKPDIGSAEAVKKTLLAAKSVAYFDPAAGNASGVQFRQAINRLGLGKQIAAKAKLLKTPADLTAEKDAEIVVAQPPFLIGSANYDTVGPLPAEMQNLERFTWAAGAAAKSQDPTGAGDLVRYLASPESAGVFKAKGMPPPS